MQSKLINLGRNIIVFPLLNRLFGSILFLAGEPEIPQ